jgi:hypothetical protein
MFEFMAATTNNLLKPTLSVMIPAAGSRLRARVPQPG